MSPVDKLARLIEAETGIRIDERQHASLLAALRRARPGTDVVGFLRLATDPAGGASALAELVDEVTIKETAFLRDRRQLESIDWRALRDGSGIVRVWCAACATGEEAYSLALLAAEEFSPQPPPVQILATDISGAAVTAAEAGVYRQRSLRGVEPVLLDRYFERTGENFTVGPALRRHVRFATHNLVRDSIPPFGERAFDLVVCRNVLIYFDPATTEELVSALAGAVGPNGSLVLGAADALSGAARRLERLMTPAVPTAPVPQRLRPDRLAEALRAADEGRPEDALAAADRLTAVDPLNPELHFVRGLVALDGGDAVAAVWSLRRALYLDPLFGLAAFTLGRAHEALADPSAARRAYVQALAALDPDDERYLHVHDQVDVADVAAACQERLRKLAEDA